MNRLVRGSIMFVAAAGAWACKTNLGENADVTDHLVATPSVVLVANTDSQSVDVEALNPQGEQLAADFTITDPGVGIIVRQDTAFLPVPGGHSAVRARFVVRGATTTTFVSTSFTISANGKSVVVPVVITPATLDIGFSNAAPALGDTVSLTLPAGMHFTSASTVTITNGVAVIAGLSADSSQIFLLLGPGIIDQAATVDNLINDFLPGQTFTLTTTGTVTTPTLTNVLATFSTAAPNLGDTVVVTLPATFRALDNVEISWSGAGPAIVASIAADSGSFKILAPTGATGVATVNNVALSFLLAVPISAPTVATLTVSSTLGTTQTGTGATGTAPVFTIPVAGGTSGIIDAGAGTFASCAAIFGDACRLYKFTLPIDRTFSVDATWEDGTDIGIYFMNSTATGLVGNGGCDAGGLNGKPETCTQTLVAGTYFMAVVHFIYGPDLTPPLWVQTRVLGQ